MLEFENEKELIERSLEFLKADLIEAVENSKKPVVAVFEVGHVSFPVKESNLRWAKLNVKFADRVCKWLIQTYGRSVRIIPTVLINNMTDEEREEFDRTIESLFEDTKYITKECTSFISERNMKNRAYKIIKENDKKLDQFCEENGKMFLSTQDECMLPFGLVENGKKIPRCGLIIASYMEKIFKLSRERLHTYEDPCVLLISFSEHDYEYERVKLGVELYSKLYDITNLKAIVSYWKDPDFWIAYKDFAKEGFKWRKRVAKEPEMAAEYKRAV